MLALGLTNIIFLSHLSYIIVERKRSFYRSTEFWMLLDGLLISLYITISYLSNPVSEFYMYW